MANPPDAGNPVRLVSPFHKIVGVGWGGTKPLGIVILIEFNGFVYIGNENGGTITPGPSVSCKFGVDMLYQVKSASIGADDPSPATSIDLKFIGGILTDADIVNVQNNFKNGVSRPNGYRGAWCSAYGAPFGDDQIPDETKSMGISNDSVQPGSSIVDITGFYGVWENGAYIFEVFVAGGGGMTTGIVQWEHYNFCMANTATAGTEPPFADDEAAYPVRSYAIINVGQMIKDFGPLSHAFADIYISNGSINASIPVTGGTAMIKATVYDMTPRIDAHGNKVTPKFVGGPDRTIVNSGGVVVQDTQTFTPAVPSGAGNIIQHVALIDYATGITTPNPGH